MTNFNSLNNIRNHSKNRKCDCDNVEKTGCALCDNRQKGQLLIGNFPSESKISYQKTTNFIHVLLRLVIRVEVTAHNGLCWHQSFKLLCEIIFLFLCNEPRLTIDSSGAGENAMTLCCNLRWAS